MDLSTDLTKGLETIEPFLRAYNFEPDLYDMAKGSEGYFAIASYKNNNKKFTIDYHFSIGQALYQYENSIASHTHYLDNLGFADKKLHTVFKSVYELDAFENLLHDFEYLVDDFFMGECAKLKEISELQDNIITRIDRNLRNENSIRNDNIRIDKARQVFRQKEYQKCLDIYRFVDNNNLLTELDENIIAYCTRHIER